MDMTIVTHVTFLMFESPADFLLIWWYESAQLSD
jgi:hypothetical protein